MLRTLTMNSRFPFSLRRAAVLSQGRLQERTRIVSRRRTKNEVAVERIYLHNTTSPARYPVTSNRPYGSVSSIEIEEMALTDGEPIQPFVRTCLRKGTREKMDMEFVVSFLGTGGGAPSQHRNGSCTVLRLGGQTFIFDVCEGTQRQICFTPIAPKTIKKIFISHLHGDHLYGLVPLILRIQVNAKVQAQQPKMRNNGAATDLPTIEIYGPPGLYNYISMTLALSHAKINYLNVVVFELVGGREEEGLSHNQRRSRRNVFLSHYPECETLLLRRRHLEKDKHGIWTIDKPEEISKEWIEKFSMRHSSGGEFSEDSSGRFRRLPNDFNLGPDRRLHIKAAELDHVAGVQTFGYTIEEQAPPGSIDPEKAKALGVEPGQKYSLLKCGISVPTDDGAGEVRPEEVLIPGSLLRPRKFAILADHRRVTKPMIELCSNVDLLVHEATLSITDGLEKAIVHGHSTASNAGSFGRENNCRVVVLNHFGKINSKAHTQKLLSEARLSNKKTSQIVASHDFMEIRIPRGGFDFST